MQTGLPSSHSIKVSKKLDSCLSYNIYIDLLLLIFEERAQSTFEGEILNISQYKTMKICLKLLQSELVCWMPEMSIIKYKQLKQETT